MAMQANFTQRFVNSRGQGIGGPGNLPWMHAQAATAQSPAQTLARLWKYLLGSRWRLGAVGLCVLVATVFGLMAPYLISLAIDAMVGKGKTNFGALGTWVTLSALFYLGGAAATWVQTWLMIDVSQATVKTLRRDLYNHVQTLPLRYLDRQPHGELMSRLGNDIENISTTLSQTLTQTASSVITLTGTLAFMLWLNPLLAVVSLVAVPIGLFITTKIAQGTRKHFSAQQAQLGELNGFVEEQISGLKVVKAFGREQESGRTFVQMSQRLCESGIKAQFYSGVIPPFMGLINNMSYALVAVVGALMATQGWITVGLIAAFTIYAKQFGRPVSELANQFNLVQAAIAGAERVFEVMDEKPEFSGLVEQTPVTNVEGEVRFENVSFSYLTNQPVLRDVTLTVSPGQTVALVGPTGAGKTTVINLLTRFYEVDQGAILLDGRDLKTIEKTSLRSCLGLVLQDSYLFSASLRDNIRYGRLDASDEEIEDAARLANIHTFISRLPQGYNTLLSEQASNLSQGQRQLITIARAVLADPAILILDEATSSVDTRTELHIQEALLNLMRGRTCFVIAHRLSTIRTADQILVIDGGRIVERGNHEELLAQKGHYYRLYRTQFRRKQGEEPL